MNSDPARQPAVVPVARIAPPRIANMKAKSVVKRMNLAIIED
jgi:hypothetical protein